jgi:hypothetical protein
MPPKQQDWRVHQGASRGHLGGMNAVGDSHAIVGNAGQIQPRIFCKMAANGGDAIEMAEIVLGHGPGMAADPRQERLTRGTDQGAQLTADQVGDGLIVKVELLGMR